ncbi:MAG: MurR/RpiR family transcriptional regulator [Marinobacterium sp.]|nr:MurR/RpiR family transcriptional regulator [Marinobacterium sp.]
MTVFPHPPSTFEQLQQLLLDMGQGRSDVRLGPRAAEVLARLVAQPEQVAVGNISSLARDTGVNASTLTRLSKSLGYGGFNEFQAVFRQTVTEAGADYYSQQVNRLLGEPCQELEGFQRIVNESMQNLQQCLRQLDAGQLHLAAQWLAYGPRVRVYAERQFFSLAGFLRYGLGMIRPGVMQLQPDRGLADNLIDLTADDVLLVASCMPYTRKVVEIAEAMKERGVRVIALTDYPASPLMACADISFLIPHSSSYIVNSMAAHIVFAEGLVNSVAGLLGDDARRMLQANEAMIRRLQIEY